MNQTYEFVSELDLINQCQSANAIYVYVVFSMILLSTITFNILML